MSHRHLVPVWLMVGEGQLCLAMLCLFGLAAVANHWTHWHMPPEGYGLLLTGWTLLQTEWLWRADRRSVAAFCAGAAFLLDVYVTAMRQLPVSWRVDPELPTILLCILWLAAMYRLWVELPRYAREAGDADFRMEGVAWPMPTATLQGNIYRFGRQQRAKLSPSKD